MKVNIVCSGVNGDDHRILHRLARTLAYGTGWGLSETPDPKAELNYFFPYLDIPEKFTQTQTAAWYTHRDTTIRGKASVWDWSAQEVGRRLTSAKMYMGGLAKHGPTFYVTPPLDRVKFSPRKKQKSIKPVIGVSGYCYRGGRKGENLVRQLMQKPLINGINLTGAGRGWPCQMRHYDWKELETFYQGLDVYLLPSSIEGIGYGVLEALACGIKVVVPEGVGVIDELPDTPGIYRFKARNYPSMEKALQEAIGGRVDPEGLRAVTERFTEDAWVQDHLVALDEVQEVKHWEVSKGEMGLYVVAFGEPARNCAIRCIETFKKHMPGIPVALCSDRSLGPEDILIVEDEVDVGARSQKVRIYDLAPNWEYVLYLDADTETIAPIPQFFDWLKDGWELVMCKNPGKFHLAANMGRSDNSGECQEVFNQWGTDQMMQWNGGVFSFRRCEATQRLFHRWYAEWNRYGKRDQGALLRALWRNPVRAMWLGNEWNLVEVYDPKERSAGIIHHPMTARRWTGIIEGRSDSPEAWARVKASGKADR